MGRGHFASEEGLICLETFFRRVGSKMSHLSLETGQSSLYVIRKAQKILQRYFTFQQFFLKHK
jgi:hypothetical protein